MLSFSSGKVPRSMLDIESSEELQRHLTEHGLAGSVSMWTVVKAIQ